MQLCLKHGENWSFQFYKPVNSLFLLSQFELSKLTRSEILEQGAKAGPVGSTRWGSEGFLP